MQMYDSDTNIAKALKVATCFVEQNIKKNPWEAGSCETSQVIYKCTLDVATFYTGIVQIQAYGCIGAS